MSSQTHMTWQADTRTGQTRPCVFICLSMTSHADMNSRANLIWQADARSRLTRPCCFICFSMTTQADNISQANNTSQGNTRARLTRPCFFICFPIISGRRMVLPKAFRVRHFWQNELASKPVQKVFQNNPLGSISELSGGGVLCEGSARQKWS